MCKYCLQTTCPSGCPNAEPPKPVYECLTCGEGIYDGDEYYDVDGDIYCENCMYCYKKVAGGD